MERQICFRKCGQCSLYL